MFIRQHEVATRTGETEEQEDALAGEGPKGIVNTRRTSRWGARRYAALRTENEQVGSRDTRFRWSEKGRKGTSKGALARTREAEDTHGHRAEREGVGGSTVLRMGSHAGYQHCRVTAP